MNEKIETIVNNYLNGNKNDALLEIVEYCSAKFFTDFYTYELHTSGDLRLWQEMALFYFKSCIR